MKLLLIEDEIKFGQSLKKALESESYAVDWCQTGESGAHRGLIEEYDAAIIDIGLPDISGLEVVKKLRAAESTLPILMLTALGQTKDKVTGLDTGADDYLVKPVVFEELLARLRSLMRRPSQVDPVIYTCGALSLDPTTRRVTRHDQEIRLSLKEYALLEYFMRHQDKVVSRQELLDHVWDNSVDPFSNTIDVYIGYVRQKIDKAFPDDAPLLHTIKGIGYKLSNEA